MYWLSSSGYLELYLTFEQAQMGAHPGPCDTGVEALRQLPGIRAQLEALHVIVYALSDIRSDLDDAPDTWPGYCPVCGQEARIWCAVAGHWECGYCNWTGRAPERVSCCRKESS
jgi:hypothetical protein